MEEKNGRFCPVLTEKTIEENMEIILNCENYLVKNPDFVNVHKCGGVHEHTAQRKEFRGHVKEHVRDYCIEKKVPKKFDSLFEDTLLRNFGSSTSGISGFLGIYSDATRLAYNRLLSVYSQ